MLEEEEMRLRCSLYRQGKKKKVRSTPVFCSPTSRRLLGWIDSGCSHQFWHLERSALDELYLF